MDDRHRFTKEAVRTNFEEIAGTREIITRLKEKGLRLGLLSDHAREWADFCDHKFGYHELFHSVLYSFEVALSKPDKRLYTMILKRLKCRPEECIFVDDKEENLIPAREPGSRTIRFESARQLENALVSLGILDNRLTGCLPSRGFSLSAP